MRRSNWILTVGLMLSLIGCDRLGQLPEVFNSKSKTVVAADAQAVVNPVVNNVELAKIILKPKRHDLSVKRDPFKPLLLGADQGFGSIEGQVDEQILKDIQFLGLIKVGDKATALLKVHDDTGAYQVNDECMKMTVTEINDDFVLLKSGSKVLKLKRGDK